jgi:tetratricopeptide (TPR) repeat protein
MPRSGAAPNTFALRALAVSCAAYVVAAAAASSRPDPVRWGLHLLGFLDPVPRALLLVVATAGALLLGIAAWTPSTGSRKKAPKAAGRARDARWIAPLLLALYGAVLYALRARTHLLGDGIVWLNALQSEEAKPFSEPLSAAIWKGFVGIAGILRLPLEPDTYAVLPVLCGMASAAIAWGIAREATESRGAWLAALGLVLTAGFTQLYFGYIESYPIVSTALLAVIWLALRHARGADPPWLLGVVFATAVGCHLLSLTLAPAYAAAVVSRPGSAPRKIALLVLPAVLAPAILVAAGTKPENWLEPFRTATTGSSTGVAAPHLVRPYAALSLEHASDVAQGILLAIPLAALALLAALLAWIRGRLGGGGGPPRRLSPAALVLAAAALPGLAAAAALMLPVAPAQDWDLTAVLLLPSGVAGSIVLARLVGADPRARAGILALSAASLLSFVLVNASVRAGIQRFAVLIAEGARVSPYGLGYANSVLSEYFEDHGQLESALVHARKALAAESTNARFWLRSGTILYKMGHYDEAQTELEEAIRRGTVRSGAHYNLALCYIRKGRLDDAVANFRAAVAMSPDRPDYRHNLGMALYMAGKTDSARVVWTEVRRRWPQFNLTEQAMARRFGPGSPTR